VPAIRETSDAGTPIVALAPQSAEAQAFLTVAKLVMRRSLPTRPARAF
jgi:MinD-like ATPase involved in chromosome partitioning or flagellar assembly